ncbi:MAG: TIGR00341 family protein [Candidatus Cryptobacteroides sp.]
MEFFKNLWAELGRIGNISEHIDKAAAAKSIRSNIHFRGPNIWILAFSIIIASIGLNVNSIPVIIGAMLISPLMGPIFGLGLGLGINDLQLLKDSLKNLGVMVVISLIASFLYFLITPLSLANPTELLARTNPTIYDVLIALFGGFAGIFELCRKEKGTVFSGVAIATALMPPLCTAGFGLACGNFSYFFGALYLFLINCIFITLATYFTVKYLGFISIEFADQKVEKRTKTLITAVVLIVIIPSIWSAIVMIRENNFNESATEFVKTNKTLAKGYIYDYKVTHHKGSKVEIFISGEPLTANEKSRLYESAKEFGLEEDQLIINEHLISEGADQMDIVKGIYERSDSEINKRETEIKRLEKELAKLRETEVPYSQITKEVVNQYPQIREITIAKGASVSADNFEVKSNMLVIVKTDSLLTEQEKIRLNDWMKIRLNEDSVTLMEDMAQKSSPNE